MRLRSLCALYVVAAAVLAVVTVETLVQEACEGPPSDCGNCDCGAGRYPTLSASMAEPERFKRGKWLLTLAITGLVVWDVLFAERFRSVAQASRNLSTWTAGLSEASGGVKRMGEGGSTV